MWLTSSFGAQDRKHPIGSFPRSPSSLPSSASGKWPQQERQGTTLFWKTTSLYDQTKATDEEELTLWTVCTFTSSKLLAHREISTCFQRRGSWKGRGKLKYANEASAATAHALAITFVVLCCRFCHTQLAIRLRLSLSLWRVYRTGL